MGYSELYLKILDRNEYPSDLICTLFPNNRGMLVSNVKSNKHLFVQRALYVFSRNDPVSYYVLEIGDHAISLCDHIKLDGNSATRINTKRLMGSIADMSIAE